jgi:hypothetical protein
LLTYSVKRKQEDGDPWGTPCTAEITAFPRILLEILYNDNKA